MQSTGAIGDTAPAETALIEASRAPVDPDRVADFLTAPGRWQVRCVPATGSTNNDLVSAAATGAESGSVLIAEHQTAGRGRRGRTWIAPAGAGLTMSVLVEAPEVKSLWRGWVSALAGVALVHAVDRSQRSDETARMPAGTPRPAAPGDQESGTGLKWPNDFVIDGLKCAGLLAQLTPDGRFVLGFGLNVSLRATELPRPDATSLLLAGLGSLDRALLAAAILDGVGVLLDPWRSAQGEPDTSGLRGAYEERCVTLGRRVRAELADGGVVVGTAVAVAADGGLVLDVDGRQRTVSAADVHHLRPADRP